MKKLILLAAFVSLMLMCGCKQRITEFGVVKKIELNESAFNGFNYKYKVTVSNDLNASWMCNVILFTDELYKIGDTVKVTKKK